MGFENMRKLTDEEIKYYIYDDLYKNILCLNPVLIDKKFYSIQFSKGYGMFDNKYFIEIICCEFSGVTSLKTGINHTNAFEVSRDIYELSKEDGNNIYKKIKNTETISKKSKKYYKWSD